MRIALDPKVAGVVSTVLSHPILYPLAALSYTGYLSSFIAAIHSIMLFDKLGVYSDSSGLSTWSFSIAYIVFTVINLTYATCLSLLIERPFMKMR
jgi:hypothetical protein